MKIWALTLILGNIILISPLWAKPNRVVELDLNLQRIYDSNLPQNTTEHAGWNWLPSLDFSFNGTKTWPVSAKIELSQDSHVPQREFKDNQPFLHTEFSSLSIGQKLKAKIGLGYSLWAGQGWQIQDDQWQKSKWAIAGQQGSILTTLLYKNDFWDSELAQNISYQARSPEWKDSNWISNGENGWLYECTPQTSFQHSWTDALKSEIEISLSFAELWALDSSESYRKYSFQNSLNLKGKKWQVNLSSGYAFKHYLVELPRAMDGTPIEIHLHLPWVGLGFERKWPWNISTTIGTKGRWRFANDPSEEFTRHTFEASLRWSIL